MIEVKLELEKPMTNADIKKLAKENKLNVKSEIYRGKQYVYVLLEENSSSKILDKSATD